MSAVAPTFPHHITQTGNRRQQTFFSDQEFEAYLNLDVGMVPGISGDSLDFRGQLT